MKKCELYSDGHLEVEDEIDIAKSEEVQKLKVQLSRVN